MNIGLVDARRFTGVEYEVDPEQLSEASDSSGDRYARLCRPVTRSKIAARRSGDAGRFSASVCLPVEPSPFRSPAASSPVRPNDIGRLYAGVLNRARK